MSASVNGWLCDDAGYANVTADAVSDPAFMSGGAYTEAGSRFVVADAGAVAGDVYVNGTRHNSSGAMYYVLVEPSPKVYLNGVAHNHSGAMYLSISAPQAFNAGIGCRFDGALCVVFANPIPALSPAAYYKFNTGITVTGAGVSQWSDQSGNLRHLLQGTDAARPPLQADGSVLFDGVADFLQGTGFGFVQPSTVFIRFKQVSWTSTDTIFDGATTNNTGRLFQSTATPGLAINAGSTVALNNNLAIGAYGSLCAVFNGAGSSILVDATTETTGNAGANNMNGFTLGTQANGATTFSNIRVVECAVFASALTAGQRAVLNAYRGAGWPA